MAVLNREVAEQLGLPLATSADAPVKVLQYGDGNFLRAFADLFFDRANQAGWGGSVAVVQPRTPRTERCDAWNEQDCLFTVLVRGRADGQVVDERHVVSSVRECLNPHRATDREEILRVATSPELELIVSNTTDAGIAWDPGCSLEDEVPASYPAKLTQVLYRRWEAGQPGVVVLACELVEDNGARLFALVRRHADEWGLPLEFAAWLDQECVFASTLVDSIVAGPVRDPAAVAALGLGYEDGFLAAREPFECWVIQGDDALERRLPFGSAGIDTVTVAPDIAPFERRKVRILNGAHTGFVPGAWLAALERRLPFGSAGIDTVTVAPDIAPFERRKVRILNGAHTGFVPGAWLAVYDIVRDALHDPVVRGFMDALLGDAVRPALLETLAPEDVDGFIAATADRFDNPFIDHSLLAICLNSTSKWRGRDLPTLLERVEATGAVPQTLAASLAALIAFYTTGVEGRDEEGLHLRRADGTPYVAEDEDDVLDFYWEHRGTDDATLVADVLRNTAFWGQDLSDVPGLEPAVLGALTVIRAEGPLAAFAAAIAETSEVAA